MLNPARRSGEADNKVTQKKPEAAGIVVLDSNPAFDVTHEKSMVVDDKTAFVKSSNWVTKNLTETRDYAVITTRPKEVCEIIKCFEADWKRKPFKAGEDGEMIWCKGNARDRISRFIDEAQHSSFVQNERYQDVLSGWFVRTNEE
jgi:PLD-like domain